MARGAFFSRKKGIVIDGAMHRLSVSAMLTKDLQRKSDKLALRRKKKGHRNG